MSCDMNLSGAHLLESAPSGELASLYGYRCAWCRLPMAYLIDSEPDCAMTPEVLQEIRGAEIAVLRTFELHTLALSREECHGYWRGLSGDRELVNRWETCHDEMIQERWAGWLAAQIHNHDREVL